MPVQNSLYQNYKCLFTRCSEVPFLSPPWVFTPLRGGNSRYKGVQRPFIEVTSFSDVQTHVFPTFLMVNSTISIQNDIEMTTIQIEIE